MIRMSIRRGFMKNSKKTKLIITGIVLSIINIIFFVLSRHFLIETKLIIEIVLWISMIILGIVHKKLRSLYLSVLLSSFILFWLILLISFAGLSKGVM